MAKRLVWELSDSTIYIALPFIRTEEGLAEVVAKIEIAYPGAKQLRDLRDDEEFEERWHPSIRADNNGELYVDMPLARQQRMTEIREERDTLLIASDVEKIRLDDIGTAQQKTDIATYRQALRDIPNLIDLDSILTSPELNDFEPTWPAF